VVRNPLTDKHKTYWLTNKYH